MDAVKTGRIQTIVPNISNTPKETRLYADDYDVDVDDHTHEGEEPAWSMTLQLDEDDRIVETPCDCGCQARIEIVADNPDQFQKAHATDAGYDILSSMTMDVYPGHKKVFQTGLKVSVPRGYVGVLKSRSGLSVKHNIEVGAGVIDHGYIGEIGVVLRNLGEKCYRVTAGDKIAQMVIVPICQLPVRLVGSLKDSERAEKGFNSSGY
jgi:dUTP pyrophosphatase